MTPEQEAQFKDYGCGCRCLIALANIDGNPISKAEFIDRYSPKYPLWQRIKQCGVTNVGMIFDIAKDLGIANEFTVMINKNDLRDGVKKGFIKHLILNTERLMAADGVWGDYYHCALASPAWPSDSSWLVSQVNQEIAVLPPQEITDDYIDRMRGYFLVLMP